MKNIGKNDVFLVTGGAGFIGSHTCEELIARGNKVICFDDLSAGRKSNINHLLSSASFKFIKGNCNEFEDMAKVFKKEKIDYVFHYAATVGVKRTVENPFDVLEDIEGIKNILKLSLKYKVKKLVFVSSSEVYGEPVELPQKENDHINPKLPYAIVKLVGESFCSSYWKKYKFPVTMLRLFNVFGPRQDGSSYGFVTGIFIKQVLANKSPTVCGDGSMTRDFVYVKDNVNAAIKAMFTKKTNGEYFNVGTGQPITILELAKKIIAISGNKIKPKFLPFRNKNEIKHRYPDVTKMKKLINYLPATKLDDSLKITFNWYKERAKTN